MAIPGPLGPSLGPRNGARRHSEAILGPRLLALRLELWRRMPAKTLRPSVVSYNAAISALRQGQRWPQCLELFEQARMEAVEVDSISFNTCCFARGKHSA